MLGNARKIFRTVRCFKTFESFLFNQFLGQKDKAFQNIKICPNECFDAKFAVFSPIPIVF